MVELSDPYALHLPNLRSLFLPSPGYVLVEADLARADAQVIAWEAGAETLKTQLRNDEDLHSDNAQQLYGTSHQGGRTETSRGGTTTIKELGEFKFIREVPVRSFHTNGMSYRDNGKRHVHTTNFAGGSKTNAAQIVLPEPHVAACQYHWCHVKHPAIGELHRRVAFDLASRKNPVIHNRFGFRRQYVGGDRTGNLLGQALAWIAQSTVAIVINTAMLQVDCARDIFGQPRCGKCLVCDMPEVQLLLQIHDSLLMQLPATRLDAAFVARLTRAMAVTVPYDDPLIIPSEVKWSTKNWGEMGKWTGSLSVAA